MQPRSIKAGVRERAVVVAAMEMVVEVVVGVGKGRDAECCNGGDRGER